MTPEESENQAAALKKAYVNTFEGFPEGQLVLEDLVKRFYDRPMYVPGGLEAQREQDARVGARQVLHFILTRVAKVIDQPEE